MQMDHLNKNQEISNIKIQSIEPRSKTPFKFSFSKSTKDKETNDNLFSSGDILMSNGYFYFGK